MGEMPVLRKARAAASAERPLELARGLKGEEAVTEEGYRDLLPEKPGRRTVRKRPLIPVRVKLRDHIVWSRRDQFCSVRGSLPSASKLRSEQILKLLNSVLQLRRELVIGGFTRR
jgi:hypothetical protein